MKSKLARALDRRFKQINLPVYIWCEIPAQLRYRFYRGEMFLLSRDFHNDQGKLCHQARLFSPPLPNDVYESPMDTKSG